MNGTYGVSQHGRLEFGYFYSLSFQNIDVLGVADWLTKGAISAKCPHPVSEEAFRVEIADEDEKTEVNPPEENPDTVKFKWSGEEQKQLGCTDVSHNKWFRRVPLRLKIWEQNRSDYLERVVRQRKIEQPDSKRPLLLQLESFGDGPRFSSRTFADRINAAGLTGLRFERTKVELVVDRANTPVEASFDTDLVEWLWIGTPCSRIATIEGAPNVCPFCGFGTIVCSECGYVQDDCLKCGDFVFKPNDSGKPGLRMLPGRDNPEIVEGRLWDGSDAICGRSYRIGFVTRRLVEFLLAVHAAPFMATPVAVCVDGMSAEQRRLLKRCQDLSSLKL